MPHDVFISYSHKDISATEAICSILQQNNIRCWIAPRDIEEAFEPRAVAQYTIETIKDFERSVDYLETREDIDSSKQAFYGMSWGGAMGTVIPAVEKRLQTSILLGGGLFLPTRLKVNSINYIGRIKVPTLMLNGMYDSYLDEWIKPAFELLGTPPEDKRQILYETDHIPPRAEYIKETLRWLDKYLGPVK